MRKEFKKEYKMVKVNNELHNLLKIKAATNGESMQNITERAIKNYIHILSCIE